MRSAALHQRPCWEAVPRRYRQPSSRPGIFVSVIVPSKDNAFGSGGKRNPLLWTLSDPASMGVLKHKQALEEAFSKEALEPDYTIAASVLPDIRQQEGQLQQEAAIQEELAGASRNSEQEQEEANVMPDAVALQERLASAAQASSSHHHRPTSSQQTHLHLQHQYHQQHQQHFHDPVSAPQDAHSTHARSEGVAKLVPVATTTAAEAAPASASTTSPAVSSQLQAADANPAPEASTDASIPASIWILCCISAALTCASCVFNTALPIYLVSELKMSMRSMGMFEGLLEAFSYVVRMCSGVISDRMTSRKAAIALGFAAGAAAKFGMSGASTVGMIFAGKAVDRLANGIQAAPRDALIGDLSPPGVRSGCFGLAQSLRKWGSAVGALSAFFLMKASNNNYQLIFYSATAVSVTACLAFVLFVPAHTRTPTPAAPQPAAGDSSTASAVSAAAGSSAAAASGPLAGLRDILRCVRSMGVDFYRMLGLICCYALGHINESLLEARAMEVGFGKAEATLVVAAIAAVTFLTAYPLGRLDDKYGAGTTFAVGISALIAGDLVLLLSGPHPFALFAACLFLGVHWAVIQGPLLSIVSGLAPGHLRGTAFGIFYTVMAFTAVAANTMYGSIWHTYGANAAFATSAALMTVVLVAMPYMLPKSARRQGVAARAPAPVIPVPVAITSGPLGLPGGEGGKGGLTGGLSLPAAA